MVTVWKWDMRRRKRRCLLLEIQHLDAVAFKRDGEIIRRLSRGLEWRQ